MYNIYDKTDLRTEERNRGGGRGGRGGSGGRGGMG